jgi:hypothetical protein
VHTHTPGEYYDWLAPLSKQLQLWKTVYFHELVNHEAIVEFYSSSYSMRGILIGCVEIVAEMNLLERVCPMFLNGLPTVNRPTIRHKNRFLRVERLNVL